MIPIGKAVVITATTACEERISDAHECLPQTRILHSTCLLALVLRLTTVPTSKTCLRSATQHRPSRRLSLKSAAPHTAQLRTYMTAGMCAELRDSSGLPRATYEKLWTVRAHEKHAWRSENRSSRPQESVSRCNTDETVRQMQFVVAGLTHLHTVTNTWQQRTHNTLIG